MWLAQLRTLWSMLWVIRWLVRSLGLDGFLRCFWAGCVFLGCLGLYLAASLPLENRSRALTPLTHLGNSCGASRPPQAALP